MEKFQAIEIIVLKTDDSFLVSCEDGHSAFTVSKDMPLFNIINKKYKQVRLECEQSKKSIPLKNVAPLLRIAKYSDAMQRIKSDLSGEPPTAEISGELMIYLKK